MFWKRYSTKKKALSEAKKIRKMGKKARVKSTGRFNHDVFVG